MSISKMACRLIAVISLLSVIFSITANAAVYNGYEYNQYKEAVAAPVCYNVISFLNAETMLLETPLKSPTDMMFYNNDLYILDSGNNRIIKLDENFKVSNIIDSFYDERNPEEPVKFQGADGMTVDKDGNIYIADTENQRILVSDSNGKIKFEIDRPDEALVSTDAPFGVNKVIVDSDGLIYAVSDDINSGIMVFDNKGNFLRFTGSNKVVKTAEVIYNYLKKKFLSKAQLKGIQQYTPLSISNFDIDNKGFIYTVTPDTSENGKVEVVRRLNYEGNNVIKSSEDYGDGKAVISASVTTSTQFTDIDVEDNEYFINLLDTGREKVFQYTVNGDFVGAFGTSGEQKGSLSEASAIETKDGNIYVLDSGKNGISVFSPTSYGTIARNAYIDLFNDKYDESLELWKEVQQQSSNSNTAWYGMGLCYDSMGNYRDAMHAFKLAGCREEYSQAFKEYRKTIVEQWFIPIVIVIVLLIVLVFMTVKKIVNLMTTLDGSSFSQLETKKGLPLYVLRHPIDGCEQFRNRDLTCIPIAWFIIVALFLIETISYFSKAFIFNENRAIEYSLVISILKTFGVFIVFVTANWCVASFMDGKGRFKEILCATAYSLQPYIFCLLISIPLSHMVSYDEEILLNIIMCIGVIWTIIVLLGSLSAVHQFTPGKMILSLILTALAMGIILFLLMLAFSLVQMIIGLIIAIVREITVR